MTVWNTEIENTMEANIRTRKVVEDEGTEGQEVLEGEDQTITLSARQRDPGSTIRRHSTWFMVLNATESYAILTSWL